MIYVNHKILVHKMIQKAKRSSRNIDKNLNKGKNMFQKGNPYQCQDQNLKKMQKNELCLCIVVFINK